MSLLEKGFRWARDRARLGPFWHSAELIHREDAKEETERREGASSVIPVTRALLRDRVWLEPFASFRFFLCVFAVNQFTAVWQEH
jgi:hypothetical protein